MHLDDGWIDRNNGFDDQLTSKSQIPQKSPKIPQNSPKWVNLPHFGQIAQKAGNPVLYGRYVVTSCLTAQIDLKSLEIHRFLEIS